MKMLIPLETLKTLLNDFDGSFEFEKPCIVKLTPHSAPTKIHSIKLVGSKIYVNGHVLIEESSPITNTLIQRLKHESFQRTKRNDNSKM